jgi:signal transduction histidine kinase
MIRPRPIRWLREHDTVADSLLAVVVAAGSLASHMFGSDEIAQAEPATWWRAGLVVLATMPIAWRRRAPITTLLAVVVAQTLCELTSTFGTGWIGVVVALYTVSAHRAGAARHRATVAIGGLIAVVAIAGLASNEAEPADILGLVIVLTAAFTIGDNMRRRRDRIEHLAERAERAEREQELMARERVTEERTRIARELHDVVAHSVSVMVIQAAAARRQLPAHPDRAIGALEAIEATGRQTMDEMRRILGVLRGNEIDPSHPALAPQPSLTSIADLVTGDATLPVQLEVEGSPDVSIPASIELSAYRIVQEALTNVRKHAGPVRKVNVSLRHGGGEVRIEVTDDGWGASASPTGSTGRGGRAEVGVGHGIAGMRERVALCDGELVVGPRAGGGWRVRATLPTVRAGEASRR